jgi:hypothetical protein
MSFFTVGSLFSLSLVLSLSGASRRVVAAAPSACGAAPQLPAARRPVRPRNALE